MNAVNVLQALDRVQERELRKLLKILTRKTGHLFLMRPLRMAGCQAASNADLMSRKARDRVYLLLINFVNKCK